MKKRIIIILLLAVTVGLTYFGYNVIQKRSTLNATEEKIKDLPLLSFYNIDETIFNYSNKSKQRTLIIYFHPECKHCQYESKQILVNKEQFDGTQILMISPAPLTQIKQFNTDYQLAKVPSLKILWDKERKFENYFGSATFPTVLIYNTENQLQKKYKGEVKIETILKYLEKVPKERISEVSSKANSKIYFSDFNIMVRLFDLGL